MVMNNINIKTNYFLLIVCLILIYKKKIDYHMKTFIAREII
jgi:hypothetical protein